MVRVMIGKAEMNGETLVCDSGRYYRVEKEGELVVESLAMQEVMNWVNDVAGEDSPCLLMGERGTGRLLIGKKIHALSSRKDATFVSIDCSRYPQKSLEREIFGVEVDVIRGVPGHMGLLEMCSEGSLFLHNIDYISPELQSRLYSFIQEGVCLRVGGTTPLSLTTRILASSSPDIKKRVREKYFQEDLFYALKSRSIVIPCLEDREKDIEQLALQALNRGDEQKTLSECALEALERYSWPGNGKEFYHVMDRIRSLCSKSVITKNDLPIPVLKGQGTTAEQGDFFFQKVSLEKLEKLHICAALENFGGNRTQTAKFLGITPKTLYNKLQNYGYYSSDRKLK